MSILKAQALNQLINNPTQLKHINPPMGIQQHQMQVLPITQKCRPRRYNFLSTNKLFKEHRLQGAFITKEERDAQLDENSAKKMKEDNA